MTANQPLSSRIRGFVDFLLALKKAEPQQKNPHSDPYNIFKGDPYERETLGVATALAILFHIFLFLIAFPSFGDRVFIPTEQVLMLKALAQPAALAGGGDVRAVPKPQPMTPKPQPILVPIPDPTPSAPEPVRKAEIEVSEIIKEIAPELTIGDITAPGTAAGTGTGPLEGPGPGTGDGSGIYTAGGGVTNPELIVKTIPRYTDEGIRAKVQGVVHLQAVIRRDGRIDSFKIIRGLGYGLEELAIQEIANNWKFRPGTLNGQPVNVLVHIEVQFNLR